VRECLHLRLKESISSMLRLDRFLLPEFRWLSPLCPRVSNKVENQIMLLTQRSEAHLRTSQPTTTLWGNLRLFSHPPLDGKRYSQRHCFMEPRMRIQQKRISDEKVRLQGRCHNGVLSSGKCANTRTPQACKLFFDRTISATSIICVEIK